MRVVPLEGLRDPGAVYAARSSATEEDLAGSSFADGDQTVLGVSGDAIARAFASCFAERVVRYKPARGIDQGKPAIALEVQRMVAPAASGVAFSVSPLDNDPDEGVINATVGLGEPLVSGPVTPDRFVLAKAGPAIRRRALGRRERALSLEPDGRLREGGAGPHDGLGAHPAARRGDGSALRQDPESTRRLRLPPVGCRAPLRPLAPGPGAQDPRAGRLVRALPPAGGRVAAGALRGFSDERAGWLQQSDSLRALVLRCVGEVSLGVAVLAPLPLGRREVARIARLLRAADAEDVHALTQVRRAT